MRYFFSLVALASLGACAHRPAAVQPAAASPVRKPRTVSTIPINTAPTDTVLVFQRTPCHGTCPAYTATILRNGQVAYMGERFVALLGAHTLRLDPAAVGAMLAEARQLNFNELLPRYAGNATDLPATIITVYQPGQPRHRVVAEQNIPPALQAYIEYLKSRLDPLASSQVSK